MTTETVATTLVLFVLVAVLVWAGARLALAKPPPFAEEVCEGCEACVGGDTSGDADDAEPRSWLESGLYGGLWMIALASVLLLVTNRLAITLRGHGFVVVFAVIALLSIRPFVTRYLVRPWLRAAYAAAMGAAVIACLLWPYWLPLDVVAAMFVLILITSGQFAKPFAVLAVICILIAIGYDAVQVFITHNMQNAIPAITPGQAGATVVAPAPNVVEIPSGLALSAPIAQLLGLGDIFISGVLVVAAGRISQRTGSPVFYRAAFAGFLAGLAAALVAGDLLPGAVLPATVFLVPAIVAPVLFAAYRAGVWPEMTRGIPGLSAAHTNVCEKAS